jgi:hypothetical protein
MSEIRRGHAAFCHGRRKERKKKKKVQSEREDPP